MSDSEEERRLADATRRHLLMLGDALALPLALWAALALRHGHFYTDVSSFWWLFAVASAAGVFSFRRFDLYRAVVRYIGSGSMLPVIQGVTIAALAVSLTAYLAGASSFPRSAPIIFWFIAILLIGGGRIAVRAWFNGLFRNHAGREPVAIYGAGESGVQLAFALLNGNEYIPVAFIDDNRGLRRSMIHGIHVYDAANIERLIEEYGIQRILLAMPSASPERRRQILNRIARLPVHISTVPDINELVGGEPRQPHIREIDIGDLLSREAVPPDEALLADAIRGRHILVTGAAGTIGSEICRKILARRPARLILYDNSESGLYGIERELKREQLPDTEILVLLGSVLNPARLLNVIDGCAVEKVYHAAAYKHVPLVERNVVEGVRNNVIGTWQVANAVAGSAVTELVLISSDKAVRPTNVMGASKRLAELIIQGFADRARRDNTGKTFCTVRFGNVLRSSGSVVPLFEQQIKSGGPVTVTHPDTSRYFMTCAEASELVIQAGAMATGGEIFVLDMGEPVLIRELAEKMIHLHGKIVRPTDDIIGPGEVIDIHYTGLRPGEKLTEELVIGENITGTRHPKILQAREEGAGWEELVSLYEQLEAATRTADHGVIKRLLEGYVSGFRMADEPPGPDVRPRSARVTRLDDRLQS